MHPAGEAEEHADLVQPVHTGVPGRTRFAVTGLYRSPVLKGLLEEQLREKGLFTTIEINPRTGRILLVYSRDLTVDEVRQLVLDGLNAAGITPASSAPTGPSLAPGLAGFSESAEKFLKRLQALLPAVNSLDWSGFFGSPGNSAPQPPGEEQAMTAWHQEALEEIFEAFNVSLEKGFSDTDVQLLLQRYGTNSLTASSRRSDLSILLEQFVSTPVAMLGASAVISLMTGGAIDAAVILGVVLINAGIGFVTERQAEKTISSLAKSGVTNVMALRDGETVAVPVEEIVPGDILILTPGSYIAADIRLIDTHKLSVDESALTGESLPVSKAHEFLAETATPLGDRRNMAYMGTHVTGGSGKGVVVATGRATELGQIQTMVGEAEAPETPMQRQLDEMGTRLAIVSGLVCAGVFVIGVMRGQAWLQMLKSSVSLAVAAVPEGLPAVATTTLAMGIAEMRKRNVSVRHLDAVETLGSVQVFCMDKTGTLTMNRMAVVSLFSGAATYDIREGEFLSDGESIEPASRKELVRLMEVVSLCSETEFVQTEEGFILDGSPTEKALVELALGAGIDVRALREQHPLLKTRYRAEGRPFMSTLHPRDNRYLLAVKGSPEEVLAMCTHQLKGGRRIRLTAPARKAILKQNEAMASRALRVLGVAWRELDEEKMPEKTGQLSWVGIAGMADPMRPGMDRLIAEYHRAGIKTIMITGDQSATAQAIGEELGLSGDQPLKVLESSELEKMDPVLLAGLAKDVHVFARVSPAHKLQIVRALQESGYVVAMTGDGINDGPALKAADIGVAMGAGGTNVARDVSDVVLEDDNLHTMTTAVSQGRTIYNNIRKMIHFMVSTNLTEIEVMLAGIAMGAGEAMNPMQLLWINLVTDIFPGLALAMEPPEDDIMLREPRDPGEQMIAGSDLAKMGIESAVIGAGTMGAFLYGLRRYGPGPAASTLAFNTLTLNELAHAFSSRSSHRILFSEHALPPNPHLVKAIAGMGGLQFLVSVLPGARRLLGTTPLGVADIAVIAAGVFIPLIINEASKPRNADPAAVAAHGGVDEIEILEGEYLQADEEENRA
ncbi:MAG: HAD-IC family P-type ATPase [Sedimenticolaceae bacterium]|nr:HAD-IC family P-type ATPase [Sedimenticolaceae bacterium]